MCRRKKGIYKLGTNARTGILARVTSSDAWPQTDVVIEGLDGETRTHTRRRGTKRLIATIHSTNCSSVSALNTYSELLLKLNMELGTDTSNA